MYHDRQGVAVVPPTVPGAFLGIPEKGTIKKQKSIGMYIVSVLDATHPGACFYKSVVTVY